MQHSAWSQIRLQSFTMQVQHVLDGCVTMKLEGSMAVILHAIKPAFPHPTTKLGQTHLFPLEVQ